MADDWNASIQNAIAKANKTFVVHPSKKICPTLHKISKQSDAIKYFMTR
jgi:hypothetical protein